MVMDTVAIGMAIALVDQVIGTDVRVIAAIGKVAEVETS